MIEPSCRYPPTVDTRQRLIAHGAGAGNRTPDPVITSDVLYLLSYSSRKNGAKGQNRTGDTRIFSPLLYQLSYLGTPFIAYETSPYEVKSIHRAAYRTFRDAQVAAQAIVSESAIHLVKSYRSHSPTSGTDRLPVTNFRMGDRETGSRSAPDVWAPNPFPCRHKEAIQIDMIVYTYCFLDRGKRPAYNKTICCVAGILM